jgi:hypothetical protein
MNAKPLSREDNAVCRCVLFALRRGVASDLPFAYKGLRYESRPIVPENLHRRCVGGEDLTQCSHAEKRVNICALLFSKDFRLILADATPRNWTTHEKLGRFDAF